MDTFSRSYGALLGLAYGDAIGFPALFHRTLRFQERRIDFLWRTNHASARNRILRLTMPFTHRTEPQTLEPFPTDDTEYALFTAQLLLNARGEIAADTFENAWRARVLPEANNLLTGFSERAAIENLQRGLHPPATGNDNPQHYDDSAIPRAVPIGLYSAGDAERAASLAQLDAQVTNAEDGVYGAQAMAVAISALTTGTPLLKSLQAARTLFPPDSWIAHGDAVAQQCRSEANSPQELLLLLTNRLINTVYSYGNAAPETLPAAFVIVETCVGELQNSVLLANAIPKAAESLPALVGALCGAYQGADTISPLWQKQLNVSRGLCLPFLQGEQLDDMARRLSSASDRRVDLS
jgi:ADP-ribosylglycohydrolase